MIPHPTISRHAQWTLALALLLLLIVLASACSLAVCLLLGFRHDNSWHLALAVTLTFLVPLPFWLTAANFLLAPLLRLVGALRYVSPYLIVTRGRGSTLELHGATLFDYLFLFRWSDRGDQAIRNILAWYVEGLLALAREVEEGRLPPSTQISATSYIFSESVARRYGFHVEKARRHCLGGLLTYPTQFLTHSFARGRWALPPVHRARRATIEAAGLSAQSPRLRKLHARLIRGEVAQG